MSLVDISHEYTADNNKDQQHDLMTANNNNRKTLNIPNA